MPDSPKLPALFKNTESSKQASTKNQKITSSTTTTSSNSKHYVDGKLVSESHSDPQEVESKTETGNLGAEDIKLGRKVLDVVEKSIAKSPRPK